MEFKEAPLADLETVSLVHPKKHIEQIFSNIPKEGLVGVEKEPYADTMLCKNSKNAILRSCGAGIAAANDLMKKMKEFFVLLDHQAIMLKLLELMVFASSIILL